MYSIFSFNHYSPHTSMCNASRVNHDVQSFAEAIAQTQILTQHHASHTLDFLGIAPPPRSER